MTPKTAPDQITIDGTEYSSYATVTEADAYLKVDPVRWAAWNVLSLDDKGRYLVAATRRLDLLSWSGQRSVTSPRQELAWPRSGMTYPDGAAVANTVIPPEVQHAAILLAGTIASSPEASSVADASANVRRVRAGSVSVEYAARAATTTGRTRNALPDLSAHELVRSWLSGSGGSVSTVTNNADPSAESVFTRGYPRDGGFA